MDDFETVRDGITVPSSHLASGFAITRHDEAHAALSRIESQLASLTEENERKDELIGKAKSALAVALHYTEADYTSDGEQELIGCRVVLGELRRALSPIDPPSAQEAEA
jgi:hypothetical protein